ncbi:MAG: AAA family ATPase [Pseudomonadota bacterium]
MLTRLAVRGFKNLADVEIRFGPLTCLTGPNGAGKSNLFEAIALLAALAEQPLADAALAACRGRVHGEGVDALFFRRGAEGASKMSFEADMIIPARGTDALGQEAEASMTLLRYHLELGRLAASAERPGGGLRILREDLSALHRTSARRSLGFPHKRPWRESVVLGQRRHPYLSTSEEEGRLAITLHQDSGARTTTLPADRLPCTVLSAARSAYAHPTLLLARQEMASWRHLRLEPSALAAPDRTDTPPGLCVDGAHLAATLHHLARHHGGPALWSRLAARLDALLGGVRSFEVSADPTRGFLDMRLTDTRGTPHHGRALSDGTLRYLALAALEVDPRAGGLVCLEEPASGIHPQGVPALMTLLRALATDPRLPAGPDNPLRQVVLATYSPALLAGIPEDDVLLARNLDGASFSWRQGTWRDEGAEDDPRAIPAEAWDELFGRRAPEEPRARRERVEDTSPLKQVSLFPGS